MPIDELAVQIAAINRASGELQKVARDINRLDAAAGKATGFNRFNANSAKFSSILSATGLQATSAGQGIYQMEAATASLGVAAGAAAVGVGALAFGIGASVKAAVDFESSFADIRKTVDLTEEGFKQLAQANRDLAKELPISVNEINRIGAIAGQLGISGAANIAEFEKTIASLGITTGVSADQLATSLGTLVAVLGTPIAEIDRVGSALTELGNNFNSTEDQILDFAVRFAGAAKVVGIGAADVLAIANTFSSVGVEAERGGTAVQKILLTMQQAAVNAGDELKVLAAVTGLTEEQFQKLFKSDPTAVFVRFIEGLGAVGDKAIPVLDALGIADARIVASALSAASATGLFADSQRTATQAALENTATQEEVAKRLDTTSAQFQLLKNNINDVAISIGQVFNPAVRSILQGLNETIDGLRSLTNAVKSLNGPARTSAAAVAGLGTPLGPLGAAIGAFASNWQSSWNVIAAAVEPAINAMLVVGTAIVNVVGGILVAIGDLGGGWSNIWSKIESVIRSVGSVIASVLQQIVNAIEKAADFIDGFIKKVNGISGKVGSLLDKAGVNIPDLPTLGINAPQINIPRAGGGGGIVSANPSGDEQREFQRSLREANQRVADSAEAASINMGELDAALANLNGAGGGGGSISKTSSELQNLAGAFADWQQMNPQGTIEEFVARLELAQEGILGVNGALNAATDAAFRNRVELHKLALLFPDLTGAEVQLRIALGQIAENLRETGRTAEQFDLAERIRPALEDLRSQFESIFSRPTRETAQLELQLATLERDRLLRKQAGASDTQLNSIDAQIASVRLQLDLRRAEIDILRKKNQLADQTLLTDAAQAQQAALTTIALKDMSTQAAETGGIVYLQLTNLGNAANEAAAALRGVSPQGFASGGTARGWAVVGENGPELANFGSGARIYSNADSRGMLGGSNTINVTTYNTVDSQASDATLRKLARMQAEEIDSAIRRRGFAGANVSMNAFPPRNR